MKQYFNTIRKVMLVLSLALTLQLSSCNKVTDLQPITVVSESTAFTSDSNAELALLGAYDAAQTGYYDALLGGALQIRGYPFGAASIQQGDMRGEDMLNIAGFYAFTYQSTYDATTPNNVNMWLTLYSLINQCNLVIEGVKASSTVSASNKLTFEAEARFLRAMAYHELLIHFAYPYKHTASANHPGVPLRLLPVTTPADVEREKLKGRNTVAEVYTQILADLDFAETNLPNRNPKGITRASKGAAVALKVRVKLHQGDWAGVLTEGNKFVGGTVAGYALASTPSGAFGSAGRSSGEAIFYIENTDVDNPGVNGAVASMYVSDTQGGRALISVSPALWNQSWWLTNDARRSMFVNSVGSRPHTTKYTDPVTRTDYAPLIRYAEVLLSMAEAEARLNGLSANALTWLNAVRNRAVQQPADVYTLGSFVDANAMVTAILRERRIEFLGEGRRWSDIHRLATDATFGTNGIPAKVVNGGAVSLFNRASGTVTLGIAAITPYTERRFLWPIPAVETSVNPVLRGQQNPGW